MNHPVLFFLILLFPGLSFAVTAEDFPCLFEPDEAGRCWIRIKDPRDGQIYLAAKQCWVPDSRPIHDSCVIYYVENSRFKAPEAKCNKGKDFYYGCLYPSDKAEKIACPNFGVETKISTFLEFSAYLVTSEEYAKIRKDVLVKKKNREIRHMFFYRDGDKVALASGIYAWVSPSGKWGINDGWGETTIRKKEAYVACEYWVSRE
jgi:hypothetical protein